jgi:thiamine transport system permease protein
LPPLLRVFLYLIPLTFLALFYFYPLFSIFRLSLAPEGQLALTALRGLVSTPYYVRTLWFTLWQAAFSTLLTLLAALPAAYVFARYQFRGKSLLQALTTIPFILPTMVVAAAFTSLLGPRGWVNKILMAIPSATLRAGLGFDRPPINLVHTLVIILLAHVFYNYTIILRMVGGFWANLNPQLEAAARTLGASPWRAFWEVTLPLLRPALIAASLLVFLFDFTSFGVILILGGPRYATLEVEIYRQAVNLFNLPVAAALSLLQIGCTFGLMVTYTRLQKRITVPLQLRPRQITARRPRTRGERWLVGINVTAMILLLVVPLLSLAERSLSTGQPGYSLAYYRELSVNRQSSIFFVPPLLAVRNSLIFAGATVGLALTLGLISAWLLARQQGRLGRLLDPVFMLPLGTSAVTLGFGYIVALARPPLNLRASPVLVPLAHTLVALPFVVRSLLPVIRGIHPHLREAARVLGASSWRVWWEVDLPIVGRALLVGAVFAFTVSLGEFGATVFVARPQMPTMPVVIYRFLGQPGAINYGQALAMSTLLMIVCAVGFLAIERFRYGEIGEF